MTHEHDKDLDLELESFFEAARKAPEDPSTDLLARVLADAYADQDAGLPATSAVQAEKPRRGLLGSIFDGFGGWPVMAGLATATVAGVWIGYNPPIALDSLSAQFFDSGYGLTIDSSLPDYDGLWADG